MKDELGRRNRIELELGLVVELDFLESPRNLGLSCELCLLCRVKIEFEAEFEFDCPYFILLT
jgi:hypothetical protein